MSASGRRGPEALKMSSSISFWVPGLALIAGGLAVVLGKRALMASLSYSEIRVEPSKVDPRSECVLAAPSALRRPGKMVFARGPTKAVATRKMGSERVTR